MKLFIVEVEFLSLVRLPVVARPGLAWRILALPISLIQAVMVFLLLFILFFELLGLIFFLLALQLYLALCGSGQILAFACLIIRVIRQVLDELSMILQVSPLVVFL